MEVSFKKLFKSLTIIDPSDGGCLSLIICFFLSLFIAIFSSKNYYTIEMTRKIISILLTVQLGIFASFFTVFSIVITFMNEKTIVHLLKIKKEKKYDYIKSTIDYMENAGYLYCLSIFILITTSIVLIVIPDGFVLFDICKYNFVFSTIFLCFYYTFTFRVIVELKSIIWNSMILLRGSIDLKILDI